jgi:hypothetical protein
MLAEIFRAGVKAVDQGQFEAAVAVVMHAVPTGGVAGAQGGARVRRNVAGSGDAGTPTPGRSGRVAAAPPTLA